MPKGLVRYQKSGDFHFITFSCYRRMLCLAKIQSGPEKGLIRELEAGFSTDS
jgi:hypothetical protein